MQFKIKSIDISSSIETVMVLYDEEHKNFEIKESYEIFF
jgi:hypothetical protein